MSHGFHGSFLWFERILTYTYITKRHQALYVHWPMMYPGFLLIILNILLIFTFVCFNEEISSLDG